MNENNLTKKPHQIEKFTDAEILEVARCANPVTGPLYFLSNYFYVQHAIQGRLKYKPYSYQKELIDVYTKNRFSINLLSRQTGKCFFYRTKVNVINNTITTTQVGDILWNDLTITQKVITKLEDWLVKLAKLED